MKIEGLETQFPTAVEMMNESWANWCAFYAFDKQNYWGGACIMAYVIVHFKRQDLFYFYAFANIFQNLNIFHRSSDLLVQKGKMKQKHLAIKRHPSKFREPLKTPGKWTSPWSNRTMRRQIIFEFLLTQKLHFLQLRLSDYSQVHLDLTVDEMSSYFRKETVPKILITSTENPHTVSTPRAWYICVHNI